MQTVAKIFCSEFPSKVSQAVFPCHWCYILNNAVDRKPKYE